METKFDKNLLNRVKMMKGLQKQSYVAPPPPTPPMQPPMQQGGMDPMMQQGGMMPPGPPAGPPGPAMAAQPSPPGQPPLPGDATGGAMPPDMEQLVQMAVDALSQGADPNQLMQMMQQQGYPPEVAQQAIEQAMQMLQGPPPGQGPPEQGGSPARLKEMMETKLKDDMSQKQMDPESRITMLESKIESLTEVIQDMMDGLPPKQASDNSYIQATLDSLSYGDYYTI